MIDKTPLENMGQREFAELKSQYLNGNVLDPEALERIRDVVDCGKPYTGSVCCNEFHAHHYKCVSFKNPVTGLVVRLVDEIERYQRKIDATQRELKDSD